MRSKPHGIIHSYMPHQDRESPLFSIAAQFRNERPALKAYEKAQETIYKAPEADLSVYRLWWVTANSWLVTVLGEQPDDLLERRLRAILSAGLPLILPPDALEQLLARRQEQTRRGPWVEHHYGPRPPMHDND